MPRIMIGLVVMTFLVAAVVVVRPSGLIGAQDDNDFAATVAAFATRLVTPSAPEDADLLTRVAALETRVAALEAETDAATPAPPASPGAATPPPSGVLTELLFDDVPGAMDELGRVPLFRLTFAPGAALPAAFLVGPLVAVVESGIFDVRVGESTTTLEPGGRVEAAAGDEIAAQNTGATDGSLLMLRLPLDNGTFAPPKMIGGPEQSPAEGFSYLLLFPTTRARESIEASRFSVARVTLAPGIALDSVDLGGPTPTRRTLFLVETGEVAVIAPNRATPAAAATPGGETLLRAGDDMEFGAEENAGLRAVGTEPAVVLLVRVAEDSDA